MRAEGRLSLRRGDRKKSSSSVPKHIAPRQLPGFLTDNVPHTLTTHVASHVSRVWLHVSSHFRAQTYTITADIRLVRGLIPWWLCAIPQASQVANVTRVSGCIHVLRRWCRRGRVNRRRTRGLGLRGREVLWRWRGRDVARRGGRRGPTGRT